MPPVATAQDTPVAAGDLSTSGSDVGASSSDRSMRRVASAPAFKHASCYKEVSPTAAVAAAAAAAANSTTTTSSSSRQQAQHASSSSSSLLRTQQPCSSCSGGRCNCLEVYVVSRSFSEFAGPVMKRLRPETRDNLVHMGICHYMTVFKTPDGELVQFDFGPLGGDVQKAHGPLATFLRRARAAAQQQQLQDAAAAAAGAAGASSASSSSRSAAAEAAAGGSGSSSSSSHHGAGPSQGRGMVHSPSAPSLPMASLDLATYGGGGGGGAAAVAAAEAAVVAMMQEDSASRSKRGVAGEIRERQLQALPPACMYMGRTSLTLDDIRHYNAAQGRQTYTLHENDCRHYVNSLVQYTTGVERSTQHLKRHVFHSRHADKWLWYGWFMSAAQLVTDVGNWSHVQAGAAVTLLAVTGRSTLASLKTLATPMLPAIKGLPALLPSAGLAAAAAGAAPGTASAAAAAGAAGGGGGAVMASLATSLKLPAAMLLKQPLAAGAAAGSAGAAAAVMRVDPSGTAAAAAAAGSGNAGSGRAPNRVWGAVGRPLQALGDGMAHGMRAAVLGIRGYALGNTRALQQQLQHKPLIVPEEAFAGSSVAAAAAPAAAAALPAARRGFWAGSRSGEQQQARKWFGFKPRGSSSSNQMQLVAGLGQPVGSMLAAPAAVAAAAGGGWQQQQQEEASSEQPAARRRPLAQLGQNVGRHVLWLGSAAARASGQLALFALGGGRATQAFAVPPSPLAAAAGEGSRGTLFHSVSSHQLQHLQQQPQPQQLLTPVAGFGPGHRSLSMPSLLAAAAPDAAAAADRAAAPAAAPGPVHICGGPVPCGTSGGSFCSSSGGSDAALGGLAGSDMTFAWDSAGSSSITCSSIGGSASGVGRQVLNLPGPRISWSKRATQAMIVRQ